MIRLAFAAALIGCFLPQVVQAQDFTGIARAIDGDSLRVGIREVRLFGIDAPEYRQTCKIRYTNWSCGGDAATALRSMVDGRQLTRTSRDQDVYGRTVATCRASGVDVAGEMLSRGLAITLENAPVEYIQRQAASRKAGAGIWASEFVTPSEYRVAAAPRALLLRPSAVRDEQRSPLRLECGEAALRLAQPGPHRFTKESRDTTPCSTETPTASPASPIACAVRLGPNEARPNALRRPRSWDRALSRALRPSAQESFPSPQSPAAARLISGGRQVPRSRPAARFSCEISWPRSCGRRPWLPPDRDDRLTAMCGTERIRIEEATRSTYAFATLRTRFSPRLARALFVWVLMHRGLG